MAKLVLVDEEEKKLKQPRLVLAEEQVEAKPQPSFLQREVDFLTSPERIGRQVGLAGRYLTEGVVGLGDVLASPVREGINLFRSPENRIQPLAPQLTQNLPKPETATERVVGDVSRTLAGTAATMGLGGISQPVSQFGQAIKAGLVESPVAQARSSIGAGGASGIAREMGFGETGQLVAGVAGGVATAGKTVTSKDVQRLQNAGRDTILKEGQKVGYVNLPSEVGASGGSRALETVSGKFKAQELASAKNQKVTNNLTRQYLGLPENAPLTDDTLDALRENAGVAYQKASDLPAVQTQDTSGGLIKSKLTRSGAEILNDLKLARDEARSAWKSFNMGSDKPTEARNAAVAADKRVEAFEKELEDLAIKNKQPQILDELKEARKEIAKIYTVEKALNPVTGSVDAKKIAKQLDKKVPISKELAIAGKYAQAFPSINKPVAEMPNPFSIYDVFSAGLGFGSSNPFIAALGPVRVASRYGMLSQPYQQRYIQPQYQDRIRRNIPYGGLLSIGAENE